VTETCAICGASLVPGPPSEWTTRQGQFRVSLRSVPYLVCPAGCPGKKISASVLLQRAFLLFRGMRAHVAKKKGLFGTRASCPRCGEELVDAGSRRVFDFEEPDPSGHALRLQVEGPSLDCRTCGASFLPPPGSEGGMEDLTGAIAEAISQGENSS
jgi:ribosomal protein S27E